ncbi:MAG: helix-turn-helix domain-containing protein, partial [bacterium]
MKIIKNENEYDDALARIEELIDIDPDINTELADELELLVLLVNNYEEEIYPIEYPDPIEAIKFRMDQQGLRNKDLIEYIGSKSKVSEVLNGRRSLSLSMIRKLHEGLGISASVLINDPKKVLPQQIEGIDWKCFPIAEMIKKDWIQFKGTLSEAKDNAEELIRDFFSLASCELNINTVFYRKSVRSDSKMNEYALSVWLAKAIIDQKSIKIEKKFSFSDLTKDFLDDLRRLSLFETGPVLAQELLQKIGIKLIILPNIKGIHLDGASFTTSDGGAVVVLTLRYDRIDNFWFTLFHELGHMKKHIKNEDDIYLDDLKSNKDISDIELEADEFSEKNLISTKEWTSFYNDY